MHWAVVGLLLVVGLVLFGAAVWPRKRIKEDVVFFLTYQTGIYVCYYCKEVVVESAEAQCFVCWQPVCPRCKTCKCNAGKKWYPGFRYRGRSNDVSEM